MRFFKDESTDSVWIVTKGNAYPLFISYANVYYEPKERIEAAMDGELLGSPFIEGSDEYGEEITKEEFLAL